MPSQRIKQSIQGFLGVNLRKDRVSLADNELAKAINSDLHEQPGTIVLRKGRRKQYATALTDLSIRRLALVNGLRYAVAGQSVYRDQSVIVNGLLSPNLITTMQPFRGLTDGAAWLYIADDATMYKDDGTRSVPWGISKPPDPTLAIGAAGTGLSGAYLGGYTYLRHHEDAIAHESNAATDDAVTLSNGRLAIGNMAHPSDSQVTGLGLYRSFPSGALLLLDAREKFPTERTTFSVTHGWEVTASPGGTDASGLILHWTEDKDTKRGTQRWEPVSAPGLRLISQNAVSASSMTLPTHVAGDLIVMFAYRSGNATGPTVPSGWTIWGTASGATQNSSSGGYIVATSSSMTSGDWSGATGLVCHVYRGQRVAGAIGGSADTGGTGSAVTYPALTMTDSGGTSLVLGFAGHRSANTKLETAPRGMENVSGITGTPTTQGEVAGHQTEAFVTSWPSTDAAVGGTGNTWRARTLEIRAETTTSDTTGTSEDANGYRGTHLWEALETNALTVTGSDLITNGTFSVLAPWTDISTAPGTATAFSNYLLLVSGGTGRGIGQQAITTVAGTRYQLKFTNKWIKPLTVRVGSTSGASDLLGEATYTDVSAIETVYFTAIGSTSYIQFAGVLAGTDSSRVTSVSCFAISGATPTPIVTTQTPRWAYASVIADSALGEQSPTDHDLPPNASWVTEHVGHLFLCRLADTPHHLRWSDRFEPERFPATNLLEIGNPDDPLQCAVPIAGLLGVFTRATKYRVVGNTTTTFVHQEALSRRGTSAPMAVIPTERGIVFPSHDGIYVTNLLQQDEEMSADIAPLFYGETVNDLAPINWDAAATFAAAYRRGRYYFAYASGEHTSPDMLAVYSRTTGKWYFFDHPARSLYLEDGDPQVLTAGFTDGLVYVLEDGSDDAGSAIALDVETKDYFGGDPDVRKLAVYARVDADCDGASVSVDMSVDGTLKRTATLTGSRTRNLLPFPEGSLGFTARLGFRYTGTARPRIYGISLIWLPLEFS